jgi:nickel-dependent lactate racemase
LHVQLFYGEGELPLEIPDGVSHSIIERPGEPPLGDPGRALEQKLSRPTNSLPLHELARGKNRAIIVVSDNTRAVPNEVLLPRIIERIDSEVQEIVILIANGLHGPVPPDEIGRLVGEEIAKSFPVMNHCALSSRSHAYLGVSPRGIPITLNKTFTESDLRILTGSVEPHFRAGYSGGRKSVCPGIAGRRTIQLLHSPSLLESPRASYCVLDGNPVHAEATWIAREADVAFIVNVALNKEKEISNVVAGDLEEAWFECVNHASRYSEVAVAGKSDIVITSNGGYPLDRNFYQSVKGLVAAARILKKGGVIVMASECRDGLGSEGFAASLRKLQAFGDLNAYIDWISREENFGLDQWQVEQLVKVLRVSRNIFLLAAGLSDEEHALTLTQRIHSLEEGVERARTLIGGVGAITVMQEGPYVIPSPQTA